MSTIKPAIKRSNTKKLVTLKPGYIYQVKYSFFASYTPFVAGNDWDKAQEMYVRKGSQVMFLEPTEEFGRDLRIKHIPVFSTELSSKPLLASKFLNLADNRVIYVNINHKESIEYFEANPIASALSL